ncbi:glutathione S-transferase N-terminal domain-containing protein [Patescibacteria group bacterium]|nr:glutathione S-transferase N-terminal domain-containing protein [Patescibacteria group bacterium]MCH8889039.1 glutathione S-transferase N-terminal domain-containing protein [Patescibacteria group bacterium]
MLTMYVKTGCPYCALAIGKVDDLGLKVEYKNIADDAVAAELVERGGKRMVPYLVDEERSVEMYESSDIVDYLNKNYSSKDSTDG